MSLSFLASFIPAFGKAGYSEARNKLLCRLDSINSHLCIGLDSQYDKLPLLTAGIGFQGGKIDNLKGVFGRNNRRLIVSVSRGIILSGIGKKDYFNAVKKTAEKFRDNLLKISII